MKVYKIDITQGDDGFWDIKCYSRNGKVTFMTPQAQQYTKQAADRLVKNNFPNVPPKRVRHIVSRLPVGQAGELIGVVL